MSSSSPPPPPSSEPPKKKKMVLKKTIVDHTYRDYSHAALSDLIEDEREVNEELFPYKLHAILSTPEYARIIAWMPHGRAWHVADRAAFVSIVLPTHFNHGNFESFNRSVNGWGFKRLLREGPDRNAYYHELFLRGRPELAGAMTRLINSGKRLPDKAGEPDFYEISRKCPLPPLPGRPPPFPLPPGARELYDRPSSPAFTSPSATKRYRYSSPYHGYRDHTSMPQSEPPPCSQYSPYSQPPLSESLPYSQRSPYQGPLPYPQPRPYSQHSPYSQHQPYSQPRSYKQPPSSPNPPQSSQSPHEQPPHPQPPQHPHPQPPPYQEHRPPFYSQPPPHTQRDPEHSQQWLPYPSQPPPSYFPSQHRSGYQYHQPVHAHTATTPQPPHFPFHQSNPWEPPIAPTGRSDWYPPPPRHDYYSRASAGHAPHHDYCPSTAEGHVAVSRHHKEHGPERMLTLPILHSNQGEEVDERKPPSWDDPEPVPKPDRDQASRMSSPSQFLGDLFDGDAPTEVDDEQGLDAAGAEQNSLAEQNLLDIDNFYYSIEAALHLSPTRDDKGKEGGGLHK